MIVTQSVKRTTQDLIKIKMFDSSVKNCRLFMKIKPIDDLLVTIIRSSFYGKISKLGKPTRGFSIRSMGNNNNYTLVVNHTRFLSMHEVIHAHMKGKGNTVIFRFGNCIFKNNGDTELVSVITMFNTIATFSNVTFTNNTALYGTAIYARSSHLQFRNCTFANNRALKSGGGIYLRKCVSNFLHCNFVDNFVEATYTDTMRQIEDFLPGVGGAVASNDCRKISFSFCYFKDNKAPISGDAIFQMGINSTLEMHNTQIDSEGKSTEFAEGKAVVSFSPTKMSNVMIKTTETYSSWSTLMVFSRMLGKVALVAHNVTLQCSRGEKIIVAIQFKRYHHKFTTLAVRCAVRSTDHYSLYFGEVTLNKTLKRGYNVRQTKCHPCPFGGQCRNGTITSADSFWGYEDERTNTIKFHACPSGYCCIDGNCLTYNSCNRGRQGILCGRCMKGMTENLFSSQCLPFRLCKNNWYYLFAIIAGIGYVLFFMYVSEIGNLLVRIFDLRRRHTGRNLPPGHHSTELLIPNICEDSRDITSVTSTDSDTEKYYFKGLIKSMFFFYQIRHLFYTYQKKGRAEEMTDMAQEKISEIFNLNTDMLFPKGSSLWCPIPNLSALVKQYVKLSFILLLFILLFIIYFTVLLLHKACCIPKYANLPSTESTETKSSQRVNKCSNSWKTRSLCAGLNFFLLGYASFTKTLLSSLNCVSLGHHGSVLFLQGDIRCYQPWQYIVIAIVVLWVIPFPFVVTTTANLLERKKISLKTYFANLIFPFPYVIKWLLSSRLRQFEAKQKQKSEFLNDNEYERDQSFGYHRISSDHPSQEDEEAEMATRIVTTLDGPFKKKLNIGFHNIELKWESILIGRRLILIFINTFMFNALIQTIVMLVTLCMFLIHHIWVMPFKSKLLNALEAFFLSALCILCIVSMIPAYQYTYSMNIPETFEAILRTFKTTEAILTLSVPAVITLIIGLLFVIKMFILLWDMIKCICRSCRYFVKNCM